VTGEDLSRVAELLQGVQQATGMFLNGTVDLVDRDQAVLARIDPLGANEHELKVVRG
jgi:hypothetical protein